MEVSVKIKEYDIASVKPVMSFSIQADSLEDTFFHGSLSSIAPTAIKSAPAGEASQNSSSGMVEFEAKVAVNDAGNGLLVGLNAHADIILEQKENVCLLYTSRCV